MACWVVVGRGRRRGGRGVCVWGGGIRGLGGGRGNEVMIL